MSSNRKNIERKRMEAAYDYSLKVDNKSEAKEFESSANKIPAFIHTNGVGNTFAFLAANSNKSQWKHIIKATNQWLGNSSSGYAEILSTIDKGSDAENLLESAKSLSEPNYRALTVELLAYYNWLRKFAKANKIRLKKENKKAKQNG